MTPVENDLLPALQELNWASISLSHGKNSSMHELECYQSAVKRSMHAIELAESDHRKGLIKKFQKSWPSTLQILHSD